MFQSNKADPESSLEDGAAGPDGAPVDAPGFERRLGLAGATLIGLSAMLGAGIFVLSGVAMQAAGPGVILAFLLCGGITVVTAFSVAELAATFPESGGSYIFAGKVFPIGGAFAAGWVLWLAYLLAAALYALGFAAFAVQGLGLFASVLPASLGSAPWFEPMLAVSVTASGLLMLLWRGTHTGQAITSVKVVAFLVLIALGLWFLGSSPEGTVRAGLVPFLPLGIAGVFVAMGYVFIALQGFEVIAAVGGEVRDPARTIPRAMFLSIGITLSIYLVLLLVMLTLGAPGDGTPAWQDLGGRGDQAVAVAVGRYLGGPGVILVVVVGLMATFTALTSTLLAASRVAYAMARDRVLPRWLKRLGVASQLPLNALGFGALLAIVLILIMRDVEVAGAAASMIFLISFGLVNASGLLVRVRAASLVKAYRAPCYPALPIIGITACLSLAGLQIFIEPVATVIVGSWVMVGAVLYTLKFRSAAETVSARAEAMDENLMRLRGRAPLVLVPLANPDRAETLMALANALAPPGQGQVLALGVALVERPASGAAIDWKEATLAAYDRTQAAMRRAVQACARGGRLFESVVLLAEDVPKAIARVVKARRPETVLLGMSSLDSPEGTELLDDILQGTSADLVILKAAADWSPAAVEHILVPVGGEMTHDPLRARLLGMFQRDRSRRVTFVRVVPLPEERKAAELLLQKLASDVGPGSFDYEVVVSQDPAATVVSRAEDADLVVLGLGRDEGLRPLLGPFVRAVARDASCPLVAMARAR